METVWSERWVCPVCKEVSVDKLYHAREHFIKKGLVYTLICEECEVDLKPFTKEN